jgi:hypothetical protein
MSNRHPETGRFTSALVHDKSTEAIKRKLRTPQERYPVAAHAGVASVATDGGAKPRAHDCDDCGPNAAANAKFNAGTVGARETTDPAKLIGAGVIKGN